MRLIIICSQTLDSLRKVHIFQHYSRAQRFKSQDMIYMVPQRWYWDWLLDTCFTAFPSILQTQVFSTGLQDSHPFSKVILP
jgi:hypothetical protein